MSIIESESHIFERRNNMKITITIEDDETKVTKTEDKKLEKQLSIYAKRFDNSSTFWENDLEYNIMILKRMEAYANDLLQKKGYLFLNDVYEMLDIKKTIEGQIVGWVYEPKNPFADGYVSFDIPKIEDIKDNYILLDFNVDGEILSNLLEEF